MEGRIKRVIYRGLWAEYSRMLRRVGLHGAEAAKEERRVVHLKGRLSLASGKKRQPSIISHLAARLGLDLATTHGARDKMAGLSRKEAFGRFMIDGDG